MSTILLGERKGGVELSTEGMLPLSGSWAGLRLVCSSLFPLADSVGIAPIASRPSPHPTSVFAGSSAEMPSEGAIGMLTTITVRENFQGPVEVETAMERYLRQLRLFSSGSTYFPLSMEEPEPVEATAIRFHVDPFTSRLEGPYGEQIRRSLGSTLTPSSALKLRRSVTDLLRQFSDEPFEDGVWNALANEVTDLVTRRGNPVLSSFASLLAESLDEEAMSEALRWIALMQHPDTRPQRLWLLEVALSSPSVKVRDAAIVGLSHLADPHSLSALVQALGREKVPEVREDISELIKQLQRRTS